jgi:S-adenosylmethionine synthetase
MTKILTAESVTSGHPDKLCDLISDTILDECLKQDENSRVACEVMATNKLIVIAGEITTNAKIDYKSVAKRVVEEVGYSTRGIEFLVRVNTQSPDIAQGVNASYELREKASQDEFDTQGAGDQGIMYGYATSETPEFLPLATILASKLTAKLTEVRLSGEVKGLLPDGKSQVSIVYDKGKPAYASSVIISAQHEEYVDLELLRKDVFNSVIKPVISGYLTKDTQILINASGRFVLGGFEADTGLTGRKIIVDTYGGVARHGGGAFSGKDASKVDRSGAYMARYIAKNLVASGILDICEVSVSYSIGKAQPTTLNIESFGTNKISEEEIKEIVLNVFDLRPKAIIKNLKLQQPIFAQTAVGGHFGKSNLPWEGLDKVELIRKMQI